MKKKYLYKVLRTGLKSSSGKERDWVIGEWRKEGNIDICNRGFHGSKTPLQAMGYVAGEILAKVEVRGKSIVQEDKECWSEMRIVEAWNWTKNDSVALSIYSAELVLKNFEKEFPDDKRPRKAIEAAKKWLKEPTKENESAAESAVWSAGSAASAASAAWSARSAGSAAWSASESARSAGESARSAGSAASAAYKKLTASLNKWFIKRTKVLKNYDI